jgi:hypothetical protein
MRAGLSGLGRLETGSARVKLPRFPLTLERTDARRKEFIAFVEIAPA